MPGFGSFAEGAAQQQLDLQAIQLGQQRVEMGKFQLQEAPLKLEEEKMQLQRDRISLNMDMRRLAMMQNFQPTGTDTPSVTNDLIRLAQIDQATGHYDEAIKGFNAATRMMGTQSQVDSRAYRIQTQQIDRFVNTLDAMPNTPEGWRQALTMMMSEDPAMARNPKFAEISQKQWTPSLFAQLKSSALSQKDAAEINYREQAAKNQQALVGLNTARIPLERERMKVEEARLDKLKKEGVTTAKAGDLKIITDLADRDHEGANEADIRARSRGVLDDGYAIMRANPTLTKNEAMARAYQHAEKGGVYAGMKASPVLPGTTWDKPKPIPGSGKFQPGMIYKDMPLTKDPNGPKADMVLIGDTWYTKEELENVTDENATFGSEGGGGEED